MTITNGYTTLALMRSRLGITDALDTTDDAAIEDAIETASRELDALCGRRFWKNSTAETRYVDPIDDDNILTPDIVSVTTLKTDDDLDGVFETTWAATDYILAPVNAPLEIPPGPYTEIIVARNVSRWFTPGWRTVEITGVFGYAAVPLGIANACKIKAGRLFRRKDAPEGISGSADTDEKTTNGKEDAEVMRLIAPFVRMR